VPVSSEGVGSWGVGVVPPQGPLNKQRFLGEGCREGEGRREKGEGRREKK